MLFDIKGNKITSIPHEREFKYWRSLLTEEQYLEIMIEMEKLLDKENILVSSWVPGKVWSKPYSYIYEATEDIQTAGFFFGILFWTATQCHTDSFMFQDMNQDHGILGKRYFKVTL